MLHESSLTLHTYHKTAGNTSINEGMGKDKSNISLPARAQPTQSASLYKEVQPVRLGKSEKPEAATIDVTTGPFDAIDIEDLLDDL